MKIEDLIAQDVTFSGHKLACEQLHWEWSINQQSVHAETLSWQQGEGQDMNTLQDSTRRTPKSGNGHQTDPPCSKTGSKEEDLKTEGGLCLCSASVCQKRLLACLGDQPSTHSFVWAGEQRFQAIIFLLSRTMVYTDSELQYLWELVTPCVLSTRTLQWEWKY